MRTNTILTLLITTMLIMTGCNSTKKSSDETSTQTEEAAATETETVTQTETETGSIKITITDRTDTSVTARTRVLDESGIQSVTIYCIDAYKYHEEGKTVVVDEVTKNYNSGDTTEKFILHTFENLFTKKAYIIKVVVQTEAGEMSQYTLTSTTAPILVQQSIDLGRFSSGHSTISEYVFTLATPTTVQAVEITEWDGDNGRFDIVLRDASLNEIIIGDDLLTSGNGVTKTQTVINTIDPSMLVTQLLIRPSGGLGGIWRIDSIIVNP